MTEKCESGSQKVWQTMVRELCSRLEAQLVEAKEPAVLSASRIAIESFSPR